MSTPATPSTTQGQVQSMASIYGGVEATSLIQEERLKIAIVGEPKTGKSWLAATAPGPVFIFDFDDRAESLAGKPNLTIQRNASWLDVERALSIAKSRKANKQEIPSTWVFDSVTFLVEAIRAEAFRQSPGSFRKFQIGSFNAKIAQGWDLVTGTQGAMRYLIAEFAALQSNLIFVYHEKIEKDQAKSKPEFPVYTGDITVDPQFLSNTLSLFNEVYRIKQNYKGEYEVQCRYTGAQDKFNASTTMLLDAIEKPDIMAMIQKHRAARAKQQQGVAKP
jgi:AAA domain